ncbi:MAG: ROK family protein [Spirochaetia bacterium]|nr:ROK family protein [Spirochaetia bacterium]
MLRIGVDLGGTKTESILLSPEGAELFRTRIPTRKTEGYAKILSDTSELIRKTAAHAGASLNDCTIGIGIPGIVGPDGLIMNANTTCLIGNPFQADLGRALNHPVAMENDANCFTMAECKLGAARGFDFVFGVILGTGCGGGIAINGKVRRGMHGIAGEWGHVSVDPAGDLCYSGIVGCVESRISGSGVENRFEKQTGAGLKFAEIIRRADSGDSVCKEHFEFFLEEFGRCMALVVNTMDPDAIVIGGGLSKIDALYSEGVARIKKYAFTKDLRTPVLKNQLGDSAGVFGAAWIGEARNAAPRGRPVLRFPGG